MAFKTTKRADGNWQVVGLPLAICKGPPPKYGDRQDWYACPIYGDDMIDFIDFLSPLSVSYSKGRVLENLDRLRLMFEQAA
jgi:hypothetical protein